MLLCTICNISLDDNNNNILQGYFYHIKDNIIICDKDKILQILPICNSCRDLHIYYSCDLTIVLSKGLVDIIKSV